MVNREEFEKTAKELESGVPLNMTHLGNIFGKKFYELIIIALSYAREDAVILEWLRKKDDTVS